MSLTFGTRRTVGVDEMEGYEARRGGEAYVLAAGVDTDSECPLRWDNCAYFVVTDVEGGVDTSWARGLDLWDAEAILEFAEDGDAAEGALLKHFRRKGYYAEMCELRDGYASRCGVSGVCVNTRDDRDLREALRQWFAGNVYGVHEWRIPEGMTADEFVDESDVFDPACPDGSLWGICGEWERDAVKAYAESAGMELVGRVL